MTEPAPKTRRAPKGEKRREELLDAALQVFSLEGYSGASVAKVAAIVGISVAGVLHHFPSKISLLMGVLQRRDEVNQRIADEVRAGFAGVTVTAEDDLRYCDVKPLLRLAERQSQLEAALAAERGR